MCWHSCFGGLFHSQLLKVISSEKLMKSHFSKGTSGLKQKCRQFFTQDTGTSISCCAIFFSSNCCLRNHWTLPKNGVRKCAHVCKRRLWPLEWREMLNHKEGNIITILPIQRWMVGTPYCVQLLKTTYPFLWIHR